VGYGLEMMYDPFLNNEWGFVSIGGVTTNAKTRNLHTGDGLVYWVFKVMMIYNDAFP